MGLWVLLFGVTVSITVGVAVTDVTFDEVVGGVAGDFIASGYI